MVLAGACSSALSSGTRTNPVVICKTSPPAEVAADAKKIIERTTGIPPQCVLVSATHTHTSTGARLEEREGVPYYDYRALLTRRIAEGVSRAVAIHFATRMASR